MKKAVKELYSISTFQEIDKDDNLTHALFQHSPVGIILFDDQLRIIKANQVVFKLFNQSELSTIGKLFGNTFECRFTIETKGICGKTPECRNCNLRNSINEVFQTGINFENKVIEHEFNINERVDKRWFSVNASRIKYLKDHYVVITLVDISEMKRREEKLVLLGITDELTGLFNRRFIMEQLIKQLEHSHHTRNNLSVVLLDIDDFKGINDKYGHLTGDKVLRIFSEIIKTSVRYSDFAGRYGGDEFLVLLPGCNHQTALNIFERIKIQLNDQQIYNMDKPITFSAGLVEVNEENTFYRNNKMVLENADKLLYKAKVNGRNRIELNLQEF